MFLRPLSLAVVGVVAMAWSALASAQQYRADEFLHLDLSRAVLSPQPLGPGTSFTPGPLGVTIDRAGQATQAKAEPLVEPKTVQAQTVIKTASSVTRTKRAERHAPRALVALHGRNPVEAQAREARIQVWPCKSGGICNWKR
jgi:hypothetical protein